MFNLNYYLCSSPISSLVLTIVVIWYLKFLWSRRRWYYYSRKVKGPFSPPIIGTLYKFIFADGARFIEIIGELADKYSGFYPLWVGHNLTFIVTIPEYIDKILTNPNALDKSDEYNNFHPAVGNGLFSAPTSIWKNTRRLMNTFLSRKNLNEYMKTSVKFVEHTIDEIKDEIRNGKKVDVVSAMVSSSLNISFETTFGFGGRPEELTSEYNTDIIERIMEGLFQRTYILPYKNFTLFTMSKFGKSVINLINQYRGILVKYIQSRRKQIIYKKENVVRAQEQRPSLTDYLITAFKEISEEIQNTVIYDEIFTFIAASSDTSSTAINFVLLILGIFPDVQENVYKEVIQVYGKSEPIDWKKIQDLNYLDRVFKETLRLFPIGPVIGRQLSEDIELEDGVILPKGSSTVIPIIYIQRSTKYWLDPLKFDPDRFLPDNIANIQRCSYLPFSYGPRNCIGMMYAQTSVKVIIAHLVREFYITTDYKSIEDVVLNAGTVLRPKNGFKLHVELRN